VTNDLMTQTDELASLDATGQAELVRTGQLRPEDLVLAAIDRIERLNPVLNAVVTTDFDRALEAARTLGSSGPFAGVPYLLKDLVAEAPGVRFTEGSRFLAENVSSVESELVRRLRRAGLVILGKTNTPEFGMAPTVEGELFGAAHNPWDLSRTTAGSSGGSAAAVAAGLVPAAHGNDAGGSLRFPASACGVFGFKPTRARVPLGPLYGDAFGGWAIEHALTRSVRDSAAMLDATSGPQPGDPYAAPAPLRAFADEVAREPGRLRLAWTSRTPDGRPVHPDCLAALHQAVALCEGLGHEVVERDLVELTPEVGRAIGTSYSAGMTWIVDYWARLIGREPREDELEPYTWAFWQRGRRVTAGQYLLAVTDLQAFARRVACAMETIDAWVWPTLAQPPLPLGEMTSTREDPLRLVEPAGGFVAFPAIVANITGAPAMSVPLHWSESGLPIGVHFLGRPGEDGRLFRLASQLERARPWRDRRPQLSA
jgi:amidase